MGRPANTAERRQQIVDGLMKLIARKGYAGASIQEIAREAGLASGLVHYHFESKQEILLTLFAQLEGLVKQRLDARLAALPTAGDPRAALDALIDAFLAIDEKADQRAVLCWTMISAEAIVNRELGRHYRKVVRRQSEEIERFIAQAVPRASGGSVREKAAAVLAAIHGSFLLAVSAPGTVPRGSSAAQVKAMVRGLLE